MKRKIRILTAVMAASMMMTSSLAYADTKQSSVSDQTEKELPTGKACKNDDKEDDGSWVFYWYLCGSNLESGDGAATADLAELCDVVLPENVTFVIETGGASEWQNSVMDASMIQRWVYDSEGFNLVDEQEQANMGESETLEDFLRFASENYPADKEAVLFWNHGSGSVYGAECDENYTDEDGNMDSLTLSEMYNAFSSVFTPDSDNPPLEMIGFDTCLMSNIETAYTFCDLSHYLVASEETEPGNGWYYTGWVGQLAENPGMKGAALGKIICDTYMEGCEEAGTQDGVTLSVTDLNKTGDLIEAYRTFAVDAIVRAADDDTFKTTFSRSAENSENYGGNNDIDGYSNMVDLGQLADYNSKYLTSAKTIIKELKNCVLYKVNGKSRQNSNGLSCYFTYNGSAGYTDDADDLQNVTIDSDLSSFYNWMFTGTIDENAEQILNDNGFEVTRVSESLSIEDAGWDDIVPQIDDDEFSYIELGETANSILSAVYYNLYLIDDDEFYYLGSDNYIESDWENGIFKDQFDGLWGTIDGHIVCMEVTEETDDYTLYSVPVLINDELYSIQVMCDKETYDCEILGARKPTDENGMPSKNVVSLNKGDQITTIFYSVNDDGEYEPFENETFKVTSNTSFELASLFDGTYAMNYEMKPLTGDSVYSAYIFMTAEDGEWYNVTDSEE